MNTYWEDRDEEQAIALGRLVDAADNGDAIGIATYLVANRDAVLKALGMERERDYLIPASRWVGPWEYDAGADVLRGGTS